MSIESFAKQCDGQCTPLDKSFSYFLALHLDDREIRDYLQEPLAAVPPAAADLLSNVRLILVPFIEKASGRSGGSANGGGASHSESAKGKGTEFVVYEKPAARRRLPTAAVELSGQTFLFLGVKDTGLADYHYGLFGALAGLIAGRLAGENRKRYSELLTGELRGEARGEIDEPSWRLKDRLLQRQADPARETKLYQNYLVQSAEDTMTLYLHGLCCDIDVETGPRQLPSRYIRQRLELLRDLFPPPKGYALFPEDLNTATGA